jgi:hypothetical protein
LVDSRTWINLNSRSALYKVWNKKMAFKRRWKFIMCICLCSTMWKEIDGKTWVVKPRRKKMVKFVWKSWLVKVMNRFVIGFNFYKWSFFKDLPLI